jgi:hypothetical protein
VWVDAAPLVQPPPDTDIDVNSITFPDASVLTSAYINRLDNGDYTALFGEDGWLRVRKLSTNQSYFNLVPTKNEDDTYGVQIDIDNQAGWTFLDNGTLTLPASSNDFYTTTNALIKSIADIQISAGDDVGSNWVFGGNGDLTLPSGGTISEGIVTSNPTIQLTPASPDVASQKLVIKGGGGEFYITENGIDLGTNNNVWEVTDSPNFYVYAPTRPNETLYWWIVPEGSGTSTTMSGTVELGSEGEGVFNFTVISDASEFRVRVSPEEDNYDPESIGVESVLMNGDAPSYGDYHLHLTTGALNETSIILGTDEHNVRTTIEGKIQITTPGESSNVWEFDTDGVLTLPSGMTIGNSNGVPVIQGSVDTPIGILAQGSTGAATLQWVDDFENATSISAVVVNSQYANTGDVQIITGNVGPTPEHSWTFDTNGTLTIPGDIRSENAINIDINLSDSTLRRWQFGEDGHLIFPGGTNIIESSANSLGIYSNNPTRTNGLEIFGNTETNLFNQSKVQIISNVGTVNRVWEFGTDGDLTLPGSGDIVNSTGVSQLANRVEGSWTAATGTNTYSFTVPMDGTYTMWVKCNIPNGIIIWNATASVSNSNVPAIGTQYAWNYTGGGNPILLTAIPDQIKGTAGTISTDATYAGTTSNRFDFTIANTSGSAQTVYYGYTKV